MPITIIGDMPPTTPHARRAKIHRTIIMGNHPLSGARLSGDEYGEFLQDIQPFSESEMALMLVFGSVIWGTEEVEAGRRSHEDVEADVNEQLSTFQALFPTLA